MGLAVSIGKDNDELVDNLISNDSLKTEQIEKIMRLVDRGKFMTESAARENAYKDSAWKSETGEPGFLHLSAPCIYASVLENLHLEKGMSFLNVGSGTGYLSTMVGFILGESGINHGIELYENVVKFANERIVQFQNSKETSVFEWCVPEYFIGNAFRIDAQIKYDRIYCGALVPESHRAYFCSFLKVDGVLIMPYGHALQRITRKSDTVFNTRDISAVTFSHLIPINPENSLTNQVVKIPPIQLVALQSICRNRIRHLIREALLAKQEVKMRLICNNKKPICRHGNDRNGEEAPTQQRETREEPVNEMGRLRARLFPSLNHPILLFERARREEEGNEDQDDAEENGPIRQPDQGRVLHMRHLLAMLARDRIQRHHAARANQAAQLPMPNQEEESDSEDEADELQLHNRDQGAQPQLYLGPDDNYFAFEFIPERDDDDDSNMAIGNFLDDAVDHNTNGTHEGAESEEIGIGSGEELGLSDLDVDESREVDAAENVEQEVTPNADQCSTVEENIEPRRITETDSNKNIDNEVDDSSSTASFATAQSDADIPLMEPLDVGTYDNNVNSVNNNNDEASKINSAKRQRTFTTNSSECAPQASKIKRESTSTTGFGGEAENEVFQPESANRVTDTEGSESPSSSSSKSAAFSSASSQSCCSCSNNEENKRENPDEVSSEEQAKQLQNFHGAFIKCIDSFPLTSQMRNFLKYQT